MAKKKPLTPPVLTQDEIDNIVARLGKQNDEIDRLNALLRERDGIIGADDKMVALAAKDAELTGLRQANEALTAKLADAVAKLNQAQDPVHGIEHPRKVEDLPSLNDLPAHKSLD